MKLWLTLMAGKDSLVDLKELWEPIKGYFDGLVATYHGDLSDSEVIYLENERKEGKIIYLPYSGRHDFSRNAYLYCGPIEEGSWCLVSDCLERPSPSFCANLHSFIVNLQSRNINAVYYYGKPLMFEFHESLMYQGTPHEGLIRQDGQMRAIELNSVYPNEADVRLNVRPMKRVEYEWVSHYARYYISTPWGSNAVLLGLEKQGDPSELFPKREAQRLAFRQEMKRRGFPLTLEGLRAMFIRPLDETLKCFVNGEKILNDYFRYEILGDRTVVHSHELKDMKKIE